MRLRDDVTRDMLADMMTEIMEDVKFYKDDAAKMLASDPHNEFQACMHTAYRTIEELMQSRLATLEETSAAPRIPPPDISVWHSHGRELLPLNASAPWRDFFEELLLWAEELAKYVS